MGICREDLLAPSTHLPRMVLREERESCWGHLQYTVLHTLSFMYSGRYTLTDYIHLLHSFLLCCKPTARRRLWDELPFTILFPIMKLKYSFHITKCSTECLGETFCHQIKSQITLTSKRRRMRLCWCVRFSPRIAVCNRTLTGPWLKLSSSCSGNGGDTHLLSEHRGTSECILSIMLRSHKQAQTCFLLFSCVLKWLFYFGWPNLPTASEAAISCWWVHSCHNPLRASLHSSHAVASGQVQMLGYWVELKLLRRKRWTVKPGHMRFLAN